MRAAAIGTLASFPRENINELVDQAMNDQSPMVKQSALSVVRAHGLDTEEIRDSIVALMRDDSLPIHVRSNAVFTLGKTVESGTIPQEIIELADSIRQLELKELRSQP